MILALLAIFAWMLTVLAPCVLPVLPVIMGWSLATQKWYKPFVIIGSAWVFIVIFTLLLKATTAFITIPDSFWRAVSWTIIVLYGLTLLFPDVWTSIVNKIGGHKMHSIAHKAKQKGTVRWDILLGGSLGPIFATCSPTYALLLGIVFPQSFLLWTIYVILYTIWFVFILTLVTYGWRAIIQKLHWATDEKWWFKRILWVILVVVWIAIMAWWMKDFETRMLDQWFWDVTQIENTLLEKTGVK